MAISLKFYSDAGGTTELASLAFLRDSEGTAAAEDRVVYLLSIAVGKTFEAQDGVSNVLVQVFDSASSSGVPASAVKLATSSGGLDTAVAGADLDLGPALLSGAANAVAVHMRVQTGALAIGTYSDLALRTNPLTEA